MRAVGGDDPHDFAEQAGPALARRPAVHSVILTRLARGLAGERSPDPAAELWWWVCAGAAPRPEVVAALMQTPPHGAYLSQGPPHAIRLLAQRLWRVRPDLGGVGGPGDSARIFADEWLRLGGPAARLGMRQGLMLCDTLVEPAATSGMHRLANAGDLAALRPWGEAFVSEAMPGGPAIDHITARVAAGLLHVWEVDGSPVSMAAVTPAVSGVCRVGLVFTPKPLRGKGYAAACVAAVTREQLTQQRACMLYTDLANPTSNALYMRLGYRRIGDALDLILASVD